LRNRLRPEAVVAAPLRALRGCGLSRQKARYLRDLARHFASGSLAPGRWRRLDDEAVIEILTRVKGIGRWTAEMFLIFYALRPDVLPVDDIGLQRAAARHYNGGRRLRVAALRRRGRRWEPYRTVATWYLWRALDPDPVEF
jgi:DNA-3-methyladenine glycosylase II